MVSDEFKYDFHKVITDSLSSLDGVCVSAGHTPADAPEGSLFFRIEKISASDADGCTASLKIRYFPRKGYVGCGAEIYSLLKSVTLGGGVYAAKKYECSVNASHLDITVAYALPMSYVAYGADDEGGVCMNRIEMKVTVL